MQTYWLKFTDGTARYCQGQTASDAVRIAEYFTERTVDIEPENKWHPERSENVKTVPYPAKPMIWQFEHPVDGKTPAFCYGGAGCHGRSSCPKNPSCTS